MYQVIIDGVSGSGKTTVARAVAKLLKVIFFDPDDIISAIAYACVTQNVNPTDERGVQGLISNNKFGLHVNPDGVLHVTFNGGQINKPQLKNNLVINAKKALYKSACVQKYIRLTSLKLCSARDTVLEGAAARMTFPNAKYKFFLNCDAATRASRKLDELRGNGINQTYEKVLEDILTADELIFTGEAANVSISEDAHVIDTSLMSQDEVVGEILGIVKST